MVMPKGEILNQDLKDILLFESEEIEHLFKKASVEGKGTPQEVSDRREPVVKNLINKTYEKNNPKI